MLNPMWSESLVREQARQAHGLVSRSRLLDLGASHHEIVRRIETRRLDQVHPGVYYVDAVARTWRTDVLAAVMAAGPGALASHRTAARLWQLDSIFGNVIEVTVPFNEEPDPHGVIVHRTRRANDGSEVEGIPVTSPAKTLLDLAWMMPLRTMVKAGRSAVRRQLTTPSDMDQTVRLFGGRGVAGTRKFRLVVGFVADDRSGSVSEIDLKHIVFDAPVPTPVQQLRVRLLDSSNAYPDFAWPDRMRIVEVDGFEAHGTPEQLQKDLSRQNQLMELGWEIRRFTATEIRDDPQRVRSEVVRFLNKPFRAD
jgi:hypothetical protein